MAHVEVDNVPNDRLQHWKRIPIMNAFIGQRHDVELC